MGPSNRHITLNRAINLADKDIILCSIYDDIEDAKTIILSTHPTALSSSNTPKSSIFEKQLSALYTFSFYLSFVLSDLEHDLGLSIDNRYHKPRTGVDMESLGDVVSVLKDEVTNVRFLLRGRYKGFSNESLRKLKGLAGELGGKLRGIGEGKGEEKGMKKGKGKEGALGAKKDHSATEEMAMEFEETDIEMGPASITSAEALVPEETPLFSDDDVHTRIPKGPRTPKYAEPDEDFTPSDTTSIQSIDEDSDGDITMANTTKAKAPLRGKSRKAEITNPKKAAPKKSTARKKTIKLSVFPAKRPLGGIPKRGRNRKDAGGGKA